jgi:hypothetical protein
VACIIQPSGISSGAIYLSAGFHPAIFSFCFESAAKLPAGNRRPADRGYGIDHQVGSAGR